MKKKQIERLNIFFKSKYSVEKNLIENNYDIIFNLVFELWGFKKPPKIDIYIMKSDFKFVLMTHKIVQKLLLITLFLPYWVLFERKKRKKWRAVSHFQKKYPIILLKPIEAYKKINNSIGNLIYDGEKIKGEKKKFLIAFCDQLVNVFISPKIPLWMNEGISSITIENLINKQLYKNESIELLKTQYKINNVYEFSKVDDNDIANNYAKGYWTVRYLEENYPGFLKETFKNYSGEDIVEQIILKLGLDSDNYWKQLDELLYENYKHLLEK